MEKSKESDDQKPAAPFHGRNDGDRISGERILVKCRSPGKWELYRMTGQHNGHKTTAKKNATAIIEAGYTNQK